MRLINIFIMWILSFSVFFGQQPFPTIDLEQSTDIIHLKDKVSTLEEKIKALEDKIKQTDINNLNDKVSTLEEKIKALEDKIKQLEQNKAVKTKDDGNIQYSGDWKILVNWRKLKTGMSYFDVKDLLGEPKKVRESGGFSYYYYTDSKLAGRIIFYDQKVDGWEEP